MLSRDSRRRWVSLVVSAWLMMRDDEIAADATASRYFPFRDEIATDADQNPNPKLDSRRCLYLD